MEIDKSFVPISEKGILLVSAKNIESHHKYRTKVRDVKVRGRCGVICVFFAHMKILFIVEQPLLRSE